MLEPARLAVGTVLSTRRLATGEVLTLPAASVATARRSSQPSGASPVEKLAVNGALASVSIVVHVSAPAGELSKRTERKPLASLAVAESARTPRSVAPGSSRPTVGGAVSTVHV